MYAPQNIIAILVLYFVLFLIIRRFRSWGITPAEKKTYIFLGISWAILVFFGNYGFYKIGIMSFTPWLLNALHTFLWIGLFLSYLYVITRMKISIWLQALYFSLFSFVVKYAEQYLFGIWEHNHFFWIFKGNFAYVLGWSLMDGLYPFISKFALKVIGKRIKGLLV